MLPDWLRHDDGELTRIEREGLRDLRARWRPEPPITVNWGYGVEPLTVELALRWAERLADERL